MIKSSFNISSTTNFRDVVTSSSSTSESSSTTTAVANLQNFNETIDDNGNVVIQDSSKTLSSVVQNLITIIDTSNNTMETYLLDPDNDISISESDDYNTITLNIGSDFSGKQALFTMF